MQLLPFFLFFLVLFARDKNYAHLGASIAALGLVCLWVVVAGKYTIDHRVPSSISSSQVALIYLRDPTALAQVMWSTLTNEPTLRGYFTSFFGMLGWLTAAFPGKTYIYLLVAILLISGVSLSPKYIKLNLRIISLFLLIVGLTLFLIMFAMLTTWTPYPSTTIIGIQGRYFLIPALLLSYGCFPPMSALSHKRLLLVTILLASFTLYSLCITIDLLLARYYIAAI